MNHLLLMMVCILSVEVFIRLKFLLILDSVKNEIKKVIHVIPQTNISDHWKEKVVPAYAARIMKNSLQVLVIIFLIISFFFIADYVFNDFLNFALSLGGVLESMVFAFGFLYLRKSLIK